MGEKAHWNSQEEAAFVEFLLSQKSRKSDGGWRDAVMQEAADHLNRLGLLTKGPKKTRKMCEGKWKALRKIRRRMIILLPVIGRGIYGPGDASDSDKICRNRE